MSVAGCFAELCAASQTDNGTTSMFLRQDKTREILTKHNLNTVCLESDPVFTPSLLAQLQAQQVMQRVFALIIVDVQNDFISGSLQVPGGADIVPIINKMGPKFQHIYKTIDWHPADHISFYSNVKSGQYKTAPESDIQWDTSSLFDTVIVEGPPKLNQTLWPDHCIQGSDGAKFHPDLAIFPGEIPVNKGMNRLVDSYSGFWDNGDTDHTLLYRSLLSYNVTDVIVCGLAMDYCVGFTALDAARHGFRTAVIEDATRGVAQGTTTAMKKRCQAAGVEFAQSDTLDTLLTEPLDRQLLADKAVISQQVFGKRE